MFNFIFNIFNKTKIENDNKLEPIITEPIITEPDITVCIKKTNFIKKINKIKNKIDFYYLAIFIFIFDHI